MGPELRDITIPAEGTPDRRALQDRLLDLRHDLTRLVGLIDRGAPAAVPEAKVAVAPPVPPQFKAADELLAALDEELGRVDALLARIAERERRIRTQGLDGSSEPYRTAEFTLFATPVVSPDGTTRLQYVFAPDPPEGGIPVPLPKGFKVHKDARSGQPSLRPAAGS